MGTGSCCDGDWGAGPSEGPEGAARGVPAGGAGARAGPELQKDWRRQPGHGGGAGLEEAGPAVRSPADPGATLRVCAEHTGCRQCGVGPGPLGESVQPAGWRAGGRPQGDSRGLEPEGCSRHGPTRRRAHSSPPTGGSPAGLLSGSRPDGPCFRRRGAGRRVSRDLCAAAGAPADEPGVQPEGTQEQEASRQEDRERAAPQGPQAEGPPGPALLRPTPGPSACSPRVPSAPWRTHVQAEPAARLPIPVHVP